MSIARVGDRVLAKWTAEMDWWYPGVVCVAEGWTLEIQFDDGDRASVSAQDVLPLVITERSRVFGRWQGGGYYYPGVVTARLGDAIFIQYEDGDQEWTSISMVRIHRDDLPSLV